jgi:hypothetical protein
VPEANFQKYISIFITMEYDQSLVMQLDPSQLLQKCANFHEKKGGIIRLNIDFASTAHRDILEMAFPAIISPDPARTTTTSASWTHIHLNPYESDNHALLTDRIGPWWSHRPGHGRIPCFPARDFLPTTVMDGAQFLPRFIDDEFDPDIHELFQESFSSLGSSEASQFLSWHNQVVVHGRCCGIFIPPAHTLRDGQYMGIWFQYLPPRVQIVQRNYYGYLLYDCIRSKMHPSLRQENPTLAALIEQHMGGNGYQILYDLAFLAGDHPLLTNYPNAFPPEPKQSMVMSMSQYIAAWTSFLQHQFLQGIIFSDRYFHQQFFRNLHPTLRDIGNPLQQKVSFSPVSQPLPRFLAPDRLLNYISVYWRDASYFITQSPRELLLMKKMRQLML